MSGKILPGGTDPVGVEHAIAIQDVGAHTATGAKALITSEILLPDQFYLPLSCRISSPEQRLMLAVLEDAVYTILKYAGRAGRNPRRLVREAEAWIAKSDPSWPFSYENICSVLGIDAAALRYRLRVFQIRGEQTGTTGAAALANQHRVVGRQHKVVLAPSIRRRLRAERARLEQAKERGKKTGQRTRLSN